MDVQVVTVFIVLVVTVVLFVSERLRVDVVAILIMVALPWLGLVTAREAISGLASNAVVSIIAVMILGYGVDRTGLISDLTAPLIRFAGTSERRLVGVVSSAVGTISAFMQNIGAAALFLPAVIRISKKLQRPPSRLLMPMGFAAILGGTLTMVASGPLIILNDLLVQAGESPYGLFSVTPVGLALLGAGIVYFLVAGRWVLPERPADDDTPKDLQPDLASAWGISRTLFCVAVDDDCQVAGKTIDEAALWTDYNLHIIVIKERGEVRYVPWREVRIECGSHSVSSEASRMWCGSSKTTVYRYTTSTGHCSTSCSRERPEGSPRSWCIRTRTSSARRCGTSTSGAATASSRSCSHLVPTSRTMTSDRPFQSGDTLVVYGHRRRLRDLAADERFVLLTRIEDAPASRGTKLVAAVCFVGAVGLAVAGFPLSISLLTGALVMVLARIMTIDEAYAAVDWRTVFLLAGLIPLGIAMDNTGAAAVVANWLTVHLASAPVVVTLFAVSLLATLFSLFMSNVAATVLLVPLVMLLGQSSGIDPRGLALLVAISASNSFILPTHQVNALLMSPGGYSNRDYLRAGGAMSLIFLVVAVGFIYSFYLG